MRHLIGMIVPFALALCCSAERAHADVRSVPQGYPTIQSAIDVSFNGDTVEVAPGLWQESINFGGRAITVRSTDGAEVTVIDPTAGRCFTATGQKGASARLEGFTLRGGDASQGGGVYIASSSPTIVNCVITGNTATGYDSGGGVYVMSGSPKLIGCTVSLNTGYASGGGVYLSSGSLTLENCTVSGNSLTYTWDGYGGGIYANGGTLSIIGGAVSGNAAAP